MSGGPKVDYAQVLRCGALSRQSHHANHDHMSERRRSVVVAALPQCESRTGSLRSSSTPSVAPPSTKSRSREWP